MSTYGRRPVPFQLEENGEWYYVGAEIGNYLRFHRGMLYKKYPLLWKRTVTQEEKEKIKSMNTARAFANSNIMLTRMTEIDELLGGNDAKYRGVGATAAARADGTFEPLRPMVTRTTLQIQAQTREVAALTDHLDTLPSSHPCAHGRGHRKNRSDVYSDSPEMKLADNADEREELVPIRLDLEVEGIKLRDVFTYNRNEQIITPEKIAEIFIDDLELPQSFHMSIVNSIKQQLSAAADSALRPTEPDLRIVIKLNINVGNVNLIDQFEWDLSDSENDPETFARQMCKDLALGGEFVNAIAYSIRCQINYAQSTASYAENPLPIIDDAPYRPPAEAKHWEPILETLTDAEVEKKMRDQDRNTRRMRRLGVSGFN